MKFAITLVVALIGFCQASYAETWNFTYYSKFDAKYGGRASITTKLKLPIDTKLTEVIGLAEKELGKIMNFESTPVPTIEELKTIKRSSDLPKKVIRPEPVVSIIIDSESSSSCFVGEEVMSGLESCYKIKK